MNKMVRGRWSDRHQRLIIKNMLQLRHIERIFSTSSKTFFYKSGVYVDVLFAMVVTMSISRGPLRDTLHIMFRCLTNQ
jgi:hypothetical protein